MVKLTAKAVAQVKRGPESWAYIYVFLGFLLTIEGNLIQMFNLAPPCAVLLYAGVALVTVYLFLFDGWFQNKLTGWKNSYENKWR